MEITSERDADRMVLSLSGEIDMATSPTLEHQLENTDSVSLIVIDLSSLEFMDSSGLRILLRAQIRANANGQRLSLRRAPDIVHRVFRMTRTEKRFTFED